MNTIDNICILGEFDGEAAFTLHQWTVLLDAARANGWKPAGTKAPSIWAGTGAPEWDSRDYTATSGQWVTPSDSKALGQALKTATYVLMPQPSECDESTDRAASALPAICRYAHKPDVRSLVGLCEAGGFWIC